MTTVFEEEIRSQGEILRRRAEVGSEQARLVSETWNNINYVLVAARGSSDNAAIFFQYLAGQELGLLVALATPSLYEGDRPIGLGRVFTSFRCFVRLIEFHDPLEWP